MSQASGIAGDGLSAQGNRTPTGRAIVLLASAVVLGIGLLHELDNSSPATNKTEVAAASENKQTEEAAPVQVTSTTTVARMAADVKVLVANGVSVNGAASKVAQRLKPVGYQMLVPKDTTQTQTVSAVQYVEGYQTEAQEIATTLQLPATSVQALPVSPIVSSANLQNAHILVIVGNELAKTSSSQQSSSTNNAVSGPLSRSSSSSSTNTYSNNSTSSSSSNSSNSSNTNN